MGCLDILHIYSNCNIGKLRTRAFVWDFWAFIVVSDGVPRIWEGKSIFYSSDDRMDLLLELQRQLGDAGVE